MPDAFTVADPNFWLLVFALFALAALVTWAWRNTETDEERTEKEDAADRQRLWTMLEQIDGRTWQLERLQLIGKMGPQGARELLRLRSERDEVRARLIHLGGSFTNESIAPRQITISAPVASTNTKTAA
jgi:hypothetical protein